MKGVSHQNSNYDFYYEIFVQLLLYLGTELTRKYSSHQDPITLHNGILRTREKKLSQI